MKPKWKILIWLSGCGVGFIIGLMVGGPMIYKVTNNTFSAKKYIEQNNRRIETLLTKWAYDHSNRISLRTANEIVKEVMRTNKTHLILALITVESENTPSAISLKGAKGLGQIMFKHHGQSLIKAGIIKEERDLFDVIPNVRSTDFVLSMYLKQNRNDVPKTLANYLGEQDGRYLKEILVHNANLDILVQIQ